MARTRRLLPLPLRGCAVAIAGCLLAPAARATTVVVPDDFDSIRLAIESRADTVQVRPGDYPERVIVKLGTFAAIPTALRLVLMAHPEGTESGRPRLASLRLQGDYDFESLEVRGLSVTGEFFSNGAENGSHLPIRVESCDLDSGLYVGDSNALVHSCVIRGEAVFHYSVGGFDSDTLIGAGIRAQGEGNVGVIRCVFEGPGNIALASSLLDDGGVVFWNSRVRDYHHGVAAGRTDAVVDIRGNVFERCGVGVGVTGIVSVLHNELRDCGTGIIAGSADRLAIVGNRVLGSTDHGILASSGDDSGTLADNVVERCGGDGIVLRGGGDHFSIAVRGNRVLRVAGSGIVAEASRGSAVLVEGNVVGRCGATGIVASSGSEESSVTLRSNTSYANQGHGFGLNVYEGSTTPRLERNISVSNAGFGLMAADGVAALNCNDWFFNQSGAVSGLAIGAEDYSVDPGFCDIDTDSVHLTSLSPLLAAPGCGLIGALGQGCETTTEVRVVTLQVARSPLGVEIRWRGGFEAGEVAVERAPAATGPWVRLALAPVLGDGEWVALDREATPGEDHWYRLVIGAGGGASEAGPILVPAATGTRVAGLRAIRPNPSAGPMTIEFALTREEEVRLSVLDVQGREVALLAHGPRSAGAQLASWNGEGERGRLEAGLYFIRLEVGGTIWTRRWVLAR